MTNRISVPAKPKICSALKNGPAEYGRAVIPGTAEFGTRTVHTITEISHRTAVGGLIIQGQRLIGALPERGIAAVVGVCKLSQRPERAPVKPRPTLKRRKTKRGVTIICCTRKIGALSKIRMAKTGLFQENAVPKSHFSHAI